MIGWANKLITTATRPNEFKYYVSSRLPPDLWFRRGIHGCNRHPSIYSARAHTHAVPDITYAAFMFPNFVRHVLNPQVLAGFKPRVLQKANVGNRKANC